MDLLENALSKVKVLAGSARVIKGYSVVKKLQSRGFTLEEIADDFNVDLSELKGFVSICDRLSAGEQVFSLDALSSTIVAKLA